ncbi:tRNA uracil 4-sulfurtransferase ThiI [Thermus oshimai]
MIKVWIQFFHELALKGQNRKAYLRCTKDHLARALKGLGVRWERDFGLAVLLAFPEEAWPEAQGRLGKTLGVERFARVVETPQDLEAVKEALLPLLERPPSSFRVTAKRTDKTFPLTSPEIERLLGAFIQERTGAPVRLKGAEREFVVRILPGRILLEGEAYPGPGGFPPGSAGRVVALLSGGIDSPVAAHRLMRRGAEVVFVHFHPYPLLEGLGREKAKALVAHLLPYQHRARLYLVPFGEVQEAIVLNAPKDYRVVLYRRFMLRLAERIAEEEGALALVTGDSLGQVASQTLENLHAVNEAVRLPVFRPLIGLDKAEIVALARALGTYEISIQPDEDCCSLFVPEHPVTRARLSVVKKAEEGLPVEELLAKALSGRERLDYAWP